MSRAINTSLATIQFQVNARQANAAMQALQEASDDLNRAIDKVNRNIANLGKDVPKDNPQLLNYQNQLAGLKKDLKDVEKAQRDFLKGAKAADQLWKAASEGNIESLSFRSIKAGVNGLKKRQEGLSPGDAQDMKDWRIIKEVIDEADRVMKQAGADVQNVVQTIREGGKVSEQAIRQTISTLKELKGSVDETDADFRTYGNDLDFMEAKLQEFGEAQRRAKGEIVDANDARREMNKLTEEGRRQAEFQKQQAEWEVKFYQQANQELDVKRQKQQAAIDQTKQQMDAQQQLIEQKHRELEVNERAHIIIQDANHAHIEGLKTRAEQERKLANEKSDAAETHRRAAELQAQTTQQLTEKVTELQGKLEALQTQKTTPNPVLDGLRHEAEVADSAIAQLEARLKELRSKERIPTPTAEDAIGYTVGIPGTKGGNETIQRALQNQFSDAFANRDEATVRAFLRTAGFTGVYDRDSMSHYRGLSKKDMISQMTEYINNRFGGYNVDDDTYGIASGGKYHDMDWLEEVTEKERQKFMELSYEKQKAWVERVIKKQFGEIDAIIYQGADDASAYVGKGDASIAGLKSVMNAEMWKGGKSESAATQAETEAQQKLIASTKELIQNNDELAKTEHLLETAKKGRKEIDEKIAAAQAQGTTANQAEAKSVDELETELSELEKKIKKLKDDGMYDPSDGSIADAIKDRLETAKRHSDEADEWSRKASRTKDGSKKNEEYLHNWEESDQWRQSYEDQAAALQKLEPLLKRKAEIEQQIAQVQSQSNEKTEEELRLKGELETAQGKLAESKQRENEEQQEYVKLQGEAIEQGNKAAKMETELADAQSEATQKQVEFNQKQQEGLDNINQMGQGYETLKTQLEGQEQALADTGKQMAENNQHIAESEAKKQQAQELTIKRMEEMIAALRKENNEVIPANTEKWRENEAEINRLSGALEKLKETARIDLIKTQGLEALSFFEKDAAGRSQADTASAAETAEKVKALAAYRDVLPKDTDAAVFERINEILEEQAKLLKETTGEWMSYEDAKELASKAGTDGFIATTQQMQQAVQAMERQRDALIKTIQLKQKDGKVTADEEAQLEKLEKELKDLKFEQDNFNMSHKKMQNLLSEPTKATDLDELKAAIKRADGELKRMEGSLGQNNKQYKEFAEQVRNAKNQLKEMEGQAKASATAWEKAWSRLKTYVVMYMGFNAVWQKMVGTADDLMQLSDKMGEVRKTTGFTADEVGRLSDNLSKIDTRTPLNELLSLSVAAGQLGLKTQEDVQGFTEAANKLMVALPEMGKEAATEMMKVALATGEVKRIQEQMDEGLVEGSSATAVAIEKIGSTIDRLRASSAASAPQITDFVKRVGAVGAQSGITIDQVAALGSTVDALGMRVEMSATALSRMIPAIKRNAFEVAKAIGMAPNALRQMFDEAGGGMNAMLAIFQHIKDSGMNANDIEQMLGMGGMADIMKDLNQQGARAGIVFAGLSQNVDVLREHLGIARTAYEENTAIQAEYDRMNETSAAKWERLKNTIEEMFVGDRSQKFFGFIIDGLRYIVDLINGPLQGAFQATIVSVGLIKTGLTGVFGEFGNAWNYLKDSAAAAEKALQEAANATNKISEATNGVEEAADVVGDIGEALEGAQEAGEQAGEAVGAATGAIEGMSGAAKVSIFSINGLKTAWKGLDATMKANIIVMVIALLYTLGKAIYDMVTETTKANKALGEANALIAIAIDRFEGYWAKLKETKTALDEATKSTEGLKEGSEDLAKATGEVVKAKEAHKSAMAEMNGLYGKYLGFMLTEANYANLNAAAHDKVTAAIRREMLAKQQQAAIDNVVQENMEDMKDGLANLSEELREEGRLNNTQAGQAKIAMQNFMRENFTASGDEIQIAEGAYKFLQQKGGNMGKLKKLDANQIAAAWYYEYLKDTFHLDEASLADITGVFPQGGSYRNTNVGGRHFRGDYAQAYFDNMQDVAEITSVFAGDMGAAEKEDRKSTTDLMKGFQAQIKKAESQINDKSLSEKERNAAYEDLANSLEGLDANIGLLDPKKDKKLIDSIKQQADNLSKTVDANKLTRARNNARSIFQRVTGDVQGDFPIQPLEPEKNPWGSKLEASSTDWKNMTAEQLVNRRKQMKDFVNAIQTDSDVKTVLAEDQALAAAIKKGMASDMRTVIEWYNTERLKIQDELHARHLTNTGDWMDPKKQRGAHKQFRDEMDAYLHELDAYYTERKTRIEEAGTDEGLTEAEIKNRTLNNEMEWQQRRAELQKLYSRKQKEVTEEELNAIYHIIAERTGDSESFVKAQIAKTNQFVDSIEKSGEKGAAIVHRWMSQVELDTERSYLKGQQALTKQMRAIEAIIDKERPFNGITKNLQESLSTMDILTGEMRKEYNELMKQGKDMTDFNNRQAQEEMKRTAFLLGEAENAYSTTIDRVMDDMRQKGMTAWADWLSADPKLQEALMAQLRSTYDSIQDAIKKEASQLKKQAEIMWNNILMPDGKTTLKDAADRAIAQLSLNEGRVSRANSLIGAGQASERVADKLAIKQMQLQLTMQEHYYNLMKLRGQAAVDMLNAQAKAARERHDYEEATRKELDAQHAQQALNLATAKEETELAKQREEIVARTEDSQNRLYKELREWASLLSSSIQGVFEASHAGDAEYYNERAKMQLTGKGGPGAGTYIVIDNEGTEDATAHYEYLNERQALERQHEIEVQNAQAEAWRKLMDDINMKFSETITDQLNAMLQNQAIDANTAAVIANTQAIYASMGAASLGDMGVGEDGVPNALRRPEETSGDVSVPKAPWQMTDEEMAKGQENIQKMWKSYTESGISSMQTMNEAASEMPGSITPPWQISEEGMETGIEKMKTMYNAQADAHEEATNRIITDEQARAKATGDAGKQEVKSTKSSFAAMTAAANMYGIAYQTMANDNLDTTQKVEMMIVQAAGQAAISMLTASMAASTGETAANAPSWISKTLKELGPIGGPVAVGVFTALIGGLMGLATSKIAKSKSQIAQVTGASVGAGRLATGMLTYAEGNVNEFSDPNSLTPGRHYNVDGADGKTYRAKYMGEGAKTHITSGPEFHLVGEKGREAIIDAGTTRQITLNEPEIWGAIKTLYNGGSLRHTATRRGRGVRAFADGNLDEFEMADGGGMMAESGFDPAMLQGFQQSLDRNSAIMEQIAANGIEAFVSPYGPRGIVAGYDKGKKEAMSHGEKHL